MFAAEIAYTPTDWKSDNNLTINSRHGVTILKPVLPHTHIADDNFLQQRGHGGTHALSMHMHMYCAENTTAH